MAVTASPYRGLLDRLGQAQMSFVADTFKVMLLADTYTPDLIAHAFLDAVDPHEITGTGYTAGGVVLTSPAWAYLPTDNVTGFTADPVTWTTATFTTRYAVVYQDVGGVAADSPLVCVVDFGENKSPTGVDFGVVWADTGVLAGLIP
jgi:hypothetical protein